MAAQHVDAATSAKIGTFLRKYAPQYTVHDVAISAVQALT